LSGNLWKTRPSKGISIGSDRSAIREDRIEAGPVHVCSVGIAGSKNPFPNFGTLQSNAIKSSDPNPDLGSDQLPTGFPWPAVPIAFTFETLLK
jgi:hypothetical protein